MICNNSNISNIYILYIIIYNYIAIIKQRLHVMYSLISQHFNITQTMQTIKVCIKMTIIVKILLYKPLQIKFQFYQLAYTAMMPIVSNSLAQTTILAQLIVPMKVNEHVHTRKYNVQQITAAM